MNKKVFNLSLVLMIILGNITSFANTKNIDGSWEGKIMINPEMGLRLVININGSETKDAEVTMDSPDQGAFGIPMQINYISPDSLNVTVSQLMLKYQVKVIGDSITGNFSQGPLKLPLILKPKTVSLNRPQTPVPPFSYNSEDISFPSSLDQAMLFGTLTTPVSLSKDTPVVVLINGSGTQNRDEELFDHKPFAVIADYLAKNNIAALRYDDRGFDKSTGLQPNSTTFDNAMDAKGAVEFLKNKGFKNIGLLGHSEGGLIADILGAEDNSLKFIIELGGPALPGDSILLFQNEFLLKDGNMPDDYISMYLDAMKGMFNSQKDMNPIPFEESSYEIFSDKYKENPVIQPLVKNLRENFSPLAPWLRFFINYDPIVDIRKINSPMFMLYGEKDTQVPPSINVPVLKSLNSDIEIKIYPDLNHMMQHCSTGKVTEYGLIDETISPEVLEDIKTFILSIN